jgi:hypothetical protein
MPPQERDHVTIRHATSQKPVALTHPLNHDETTADDLLTIKFCLSHSHPYPSSCARCSFSTVVALPNVLEDSSESGRRRALNTVPGLPRAVLRI